MRLWPTQQNGEIMQHISARPPQTRLKLAIAVVAVAAAIMPVVAPSSGAGAQVKTQAVPVFDDFDTPYSGVPAVSVQIGGKGSVATEKETAFVFDGVAGQRIVIRSNRPWTLTDPSNRIIADNDPRTILLQHNGKYLINVGSGLRPPATVSVVRVESAAISRSVAVGGDAVFDTNELRDQVTRVRVAGGQRYRLVVPKDQPGVRFCVEDWSNVGIATICAQGGRTDDKQTPIDSSESFVLERDTELVFSGSFELDENQAPKLQSIRARIDFAPNDIVVDTSKSPAVAAEAKPGQGIVVPFWGSPAERAVLSSPVEDEVSAWGQPWIDREDSGTERTKVFAVPVRFDPVRPPFVMWSGLDTTDTRLNSRRFGVYRGEDTAVNVPATGEPIVVRNLPWFAAVGSLTFEQGERYLVQLTGKNIRPLSLALRDPSGKFTSNINPWQWTETDGVQRALTVVSVDRGGKWALEVRPAGNNVRDLSISAVKAGGNSGFEGSINVDDVLTVGEATDVQLGPNEFARMTVKLATPSPQIIQPVVLRYRNNTFQPTAVDMSLWDLKGRMVWSNNRNLEEEVLSGRLGKEPELSEQFATVTSAEPYTLVIDPHGDLAGRFRVSVVSTPVISDVKLTDGPIPLILGGTKTGVVEVREPTRYRVTGVSACISATSLKEWGGGQGPVRTSQAPVNVLAPSTTMLPPTSPLPVAPRPPSQRCVADGRSITLPPGVHRIAFQGEVKKGATFSKVASGSAPDPQRVLEVGLDGGPVSIPTGSGAILVRVNVTKPGALVVLEKKETGSKDFYLTAGPVLTPDGNRTSTYGCFVAEVPGVYTFIMDSSHTGEVRARAGLGQPQTTSLTIGAKFKLFKFAPEQLLEANVVVSKRTRVTMDLFPEGLSFLYAADSKERRFGGDPIEGVVLEPGKYRFAFNGSGEGRITLKKSKVVDFVEG